MSTEEKQPHRWDYVVSVALPNDGMSITITGQDVQFERATEKALIRPRHVRMVVEIQSFMREILKGQQG